MKTFPENLLERFGANEPILLEEILSVCSDVTEDAVYQRIRSAIARGVLVKKQRGVYFFPAREGAAPEDLPEQVGDAAVAVVGPAEDRRPAHASIRIGLIFAHSGYRFCTQRLMLVSQARDVRRGSRIRRAGEGGVRRRSSSVPCRRRIRVAWRVRVLALATVSGSCMLISSRAGGSGLYPQPHAPRSCQLAGWFYCCNLLF